MASPKSTSDSMDNESGSVIGPPCINISSISGHDVFIQMIINAKAMAEMDNSTIPIIWRGFKTSVSSKLPLNRSNLKERLILALKSIKNITEEEKQVYLNMIFFFFNNLLLL